MQKFYSNGKLLITGEYLVLDGAMALAVPTKFGQSMTVEEIDDPKIIWKSYDCNGVIWFESEFKIIEFAYPFLYESRDQTQPNSLKNTLLKILFHAARLNSNFFDECINTDKGWEVTTKLDFPRNWGLGTSSTLINNIAKWTKVDAYQLLSQTFGGSGYDIACAQHDSAIRYHLKMDTPIVNQVNFNPPFKEHLYFLYLNKKQNSRDGIARYKTNESDISREILDVNDITWKMIQCTNLNEFQELMNDHENIITKIIKQTPIKQEIFPDFQGSIKSLGAWGGDFVMVASKENPSAYFHSKGFKTLLSYKELIK